MKAMTAKEMIDYWRREAAEDVITAESLFVAKRYLPSKNPVYG